MPSASDALPCPVMANRRARLRAQGHAPLAPPGRRGALLAAVLVLVLALSLAPAARADDHDPKRSAHPVRIVAYALHPIGVVLDFLIVRPAHWIVEREPFRTLFGHED
jgi:hypothetical protein